MSIVNRVLVSLLGLALLALAVSLLATPIVLLAGAETVLETIRVAPASALLSEAVALGAIGLLLLVLELWPRTPGVFEAQVEHASVVYPAATVVGNIQRELRSVNGVRQAMVRVQRYRGAVRVRAELLIEAGRDPQEVAAAAARQVRDTLERGLGLQCEALRLSLEPTELPRGTQAVQVAPALGRDGSHPSSAS